MMHQQRNEAARAAEAARDAALDVERQWQAERLKRLLEEANGNDKE